MPMSKYRPGKRIVQRIRQSISVTSRKKMKKLQEQPFFLIDLNSDKVPKQKRIPKITERKKKGSFNKQRTAHSFVENKEENSYEKAWVRIKCELALHLEERWKQQSRYRCIVRRKKMRSQFI